ncbi:MAG: hypothetical protein R3C45_06450 [Phycisphaerales bacterium]
MLKPFLKSLGVVGVPVNAKFHILEQQLPGSYDSSGGQDARGLPDMCIHDDVGWAVVFESKVQAKVLAGQIDRHRRTIKRCGFDNILIVVLSVDPMPVRIPVDVLYVEWCEVYGWLRRQTHSSSWATHMVNYMEVYESHMLAQDYNIRGTITKFDGIRFDDNNPYTYQAGKRLIRLLGDRLQTRKDLVKLGVDPQGSRRGAITGRAGENVWDFLPLRIARKAKHFTDYPHLTMVLNRKGAIAAITVPNGIRGGIRSRLKPVELDEFCHVFLDIHKRLRPALRMSKGSVAKAYVTQRHYLSQRSNAQIDARLDCDLRTIVPGKSKGVKYQPEWMSAIYDVLCNKRSNIQLGVEVHFPITCKVLRSPQATDLFAKTWVAMKPLLDFVLEP